MPAGAEPTGRRYRFGDVVVDYDNFTVEHRGQVRRLSPRAFDVLIYLIKHHDRVVGKQELFEQIWEEVFVTDSALTQVMKEIRHGIGDDAHTPHYIETVHKRGYRFIAAVEAVALVSPPADVEAGLALPKGARQAAPLRKRWLVVLAAVVLVAVLAVLVALSIGGLRDRILGRAPAPRIQSIAVLPLKNLSGDPEQEYFADGMTDALITELGKMSALRVISIQSVLRYKGSAKQVPEIARELNVDALVEGAVLRSGERVRITAQLIQARKERHLWADSYEGDLRDVLVLQSEVARAIAGQVEVTVGPEEEARLASARPVNPGAYEDFLRGQQFYSRFPTVANRAIEYFQQTTEKDPTFAPAYAALANCYSHHMVISYDEAYPQAEAAARKALQLDDSLAEAHCAEAYVNWRFRWNWAGAGREFRRALQLNPNSAGCHSLYGFYLTLMGRFEEAEAAHRRAIELDPFNPRPNFMLAWHYGKARRDDDAIAQLQELLELYPGYRSLHYELAHAYARKGLYSNALAEADKSGPQATDCGWVYAVSGGRKQARKIIAELKELSKRQYVDPGYIALTYAGLGEKDKALELFEKGYQVRARWMMYLKVIPAVDNLRPDPRFQDLLARMNFPE